MILSGSPDKSFTPRNDEVAAVADPYSSRLTDPSDLSITSIIRGQFIGMILMAVSSSVEEPKLAITE